MKMIHNRCPSAAVGVGLLLLIGLSCCSAVDLLVTTKAYMTISIGGVQQGSIEFGLFGNITPKTVLNFLTFIIGNKTVTWNGEIVRLSYINSTFHRTIQNFMIQGGDMLYNNGYGFINMYGTMHFDDENFTVRHCGAGFIGMANRGPNTNGCQIYITTALTTWLDGKHVIFGKVLRGMDVVRKIEHNPTDQHDKPILEVRIVDCGVLPLDQPFLVECTPVDG